MDATRSHTYDSHFGPASELIDVGRFLDDAIAAEEPAATRRPLSLFAPTSSSISGYEDFSQLSEQQKAVISEECSVDDIRNPLTTTLDDPRLAAHLISSNRASVTSIHDAAAAASTSAARAKGGRRRFVPDPDSEPPDVVSLRARIDAEAPRIAAWGYSLDAALFMRTPKNSDCNVLSQIKCLEEPPEGELALQQVVLSFSMVAPIRWSHNFFVRSSAHSLLGAHTLGDLFECIPCVSNEIPREVRRDGRVVGYELGTGPESRDGTGAVVVVEGIAYGDGESELDYADKLVKYLADQAEGKASATAIRKGPCMHDVPLSTLSLRLHHPYWVLHAGNCEHYIVFEEFRLHHPSDPPPAAFPLTRHVTPPLLDLCRACTRAVAVWAVVGDMRLGESPCMLCAPCWRTMGPPRPLHEGAKAPEVMAVPLPRYEAGW